MGVELIGKLDVDDVAKSHDIPELIVHGGYQTLDLSRMGYQRVVDGQPYGEEGVR